MPAPQSPPTPRWFSRLHSLFFVLLGSCCIVPFASAQNSAITQSVWQMYYGVTNAQINSAAWLAADDDGDGLTNGEEMAAGTNPFSPNSTFMVTSVALNGNTASLLLSDDGREALQGSGSASLSPSNWQLISGASVVGDGTVKIIGVPQSSGQFFRVIVQDQSTASDNVADWAKLILGYAVGLPISSQSSYTDSTLAAALAGQNVVTVFATSSSRHPTAGWRHGSAGGGSAHVHSFRVPDVQHDHRADSNHRRRHSGR